MSSRWSLSFTLAAAAVPALWVAACSGGSSASSHPPSGAPTPSGRADAAAEVADPALGGDAGASSDAAASGADSGKAGPGLPQSDAGGLRDVLLVGNSVAGTVSFLDGQSFENLGHVDVIPDFDEVRLQINLNPVRLVAYPIVKNRQLLHHFEPQDGDRFVDDVFVSPDGTTLYVSRSNLGDVAAFDLTQPGHPQLWRTFVDGLKADHAAISPDGKHIVVSATTADVANVIDAATGEIVDSFETGHYPHQNDYSHDGKYIFNASIGNVGYNQVSYEDNEDKGERVLTKVDAETFEVVKRWPFEWGIRPAVFTPDDRFMFAQLSYLNGLIKFDLETGKEVARSDQPLSEFALETYATYDEYPHDSAHHGLAMSGDGRHLCDCGTIDNTVSIVGTESMQVEHLVDVGYVPYWSTTSPDGKYCLVSISGDDAIAVIEYESGQYTDLIPVGDFPQRNRLGKVPQAVIDGLRDGPG